MCNPALLGVAIAAVGTGISANSARLARGDAEKARQDAANQAAADRAAADKAASEGASSSLIRGRRQRQTLLSGTPSETLGGGQIARPASRTLLGYGAQPSMYTPVGG